MASKTLTAKEAYDAALRLHGEGKLDRAADIYRQILTRLPWHAGCLHHLGLVLFQQGERDQGLRHLAQACDLQPGIASFQANLAHALAEAGRSDEAEAACRRALGAAPGHAMALRVLSRVLKDRGNLKSAERASRRALTADPDHPDGHLYLANVLLVQARLPAAEAAYRDTLALDPRNAEALSNLGKVLQLLGRLDEAEVTYRQAIALRPDHAGAHFNLAYLLLLTGRFEEGWQAYEWRRVRARKRDWNAPEWAGDDPRGATILLHAEQGFGDAIQMVRYIPILARRGARVLLECPRALVSLFDRLDGLADTVGKGEPLPPHDLHLPLMSLPRVFGSRLGSIPATVPYLQPDTLRVDAWRGRLSGAAGYKVGLVWAGNPKFPEDRFRSPGLAAIRPLLEIDGIAWFSLQKGTGREQLASAAQANLIDLADDLTDFAETAAAMANLDLIISSCTAPAHLAGALGRPVWTLLPFMPDWRWLLDRADSPWYPTMRLFRQEAPGQWSDVVAAVAAALAGRAAAA